LIKKLILAFRQILCQTADVRDLRLLSALFNPPPFSPSLKKCQEKHLHFLGKNTDSLSGSKKEEQKVL